MGKTEDEAVEMFNLWFASLCSMISGAISVVLSFSVEPFALRILLLLGGLVMLVILPIVFTDKIKRS